jgi:hypothetical protein
MNKSISLLKLTLVTFCLCFAGAPSSESTEASEQRTKLAECIRELISYSTGNRGGKTIKFQGRYLSLDKPVSEPHFTPIQPDMPAWLVEQSRENEEQEIHDYHEIVGIPQKIINLANNASDLYTKKIDNKTYLELLFYNSLGWIADEICQKIMDKGAHLPKQYDVLRKINKGEHVKISPKDYPQDFLRLAFRVANDANNLAMVVDLYPLSGVGEEIEHYRNAHPKIFSEAGNFVHEPYWSYNLAQLHGYGHRLMKKLKPYFVDRASIIQEDTKIFILSGPDKIRVRKVRFNYVLPNLYLKNLLEREEPEHLGVAKVFLVPKQPTIKFTFIMPYPIDASGKLYEGTRSDNPMGVESYDFEVFQEIIDGQAIANQRDFERYGHRDFGNYQIIISSANHKRYLIDTKENKNFMVPYLTSDKNYRETKSDELHRVIYTVKSWNFDPRVVFVDVDVKLGP